MNIRVLLSLLIAVGFGLSSLSVQAEEEQFANTKKVLKKKKKATKTAKSVKKKVKAKAKKVRKRRPKRRRVNQQTRTTRRRVIPKKKTSGIMVTPVAGLGMSNFSGTDIALNDTVSKEFDTGLNFGALLEYRINKSLGIQSGLIYTNTGAQYTAGEGDAAITTEFQNTYLYIPVVLKGYPVAGDGVDVYLKGGIKIGLGIGENVALTEGAVGTTVAIAIPDATNNVDNFSGIDIPLTVGLGTNIELSDSIFLNIDGSLDYSILNIYNNPDDGIDTNDISIRNFGLGIMAGVSILL